MKGQRSAGLTRPFIRPQLLRVGSFRARELLDAAAGDVDAPVVGRRQAQDVPQLVPRAGERHAGDARLGVGWARGNLMAPCTSAQHISQMRHKACRS